MKVLVTPEVMKKVVQDEFYKYKVSIGNINSKLDDYTPDSEIKFVTVMKDGKDELISIDDLAIYIKEDIKDEI